ncbi:hypothetical protein NW762_007622 [Fusarium torreyae]|uniref:AAA+ ATPase domain-containing protein n=1 Tax=Fusarium torreyae TaxID=1237075 RepID=A0A9W8RXD7_9HYPO|nr:hypothetical protein NW762_007622 [Fusarium torreyae]
MTTTVNWADGYESVEDDDIGHWQTGWGKAEELSEEEVMDGVGEICQVRDAFAKLDIEGSFMTWLDEKPFGEDEEKMRKAKRVRDTYAVVCGYYPLPDGTWEVRKIIINNVALKSALCSVFKEYPGVDCNTSTLKFTKPFVPLVHRWKQLCKLATKEIGSEVQQTMSLFVGMLKRELRDTLKKLKTIKATGYVSFEDLPLAFEPGQLIIRSRPQMAAGIFRKLSLSPVGYTVNVDQVMWNGYEYGVVQMTWTLNFFEDSCRLAELDVHPCWACSEHAANDVRSALIKRGRKYEELRGKHLRFHVGVTQVSRDENSWEYRPPIEVSEGRVIVDAAGYHELERVPTTNVNFLSSLEIRSTSITDVKHTKNITTPGPQKSQNSHDQKNGTAQDLVSLTDEQCMLAVSTVKCFALDKKVRCNMEVDHLVDIKWNSQAFEKLVLDDSEKRLVLGFVGANKGGQLEDFDDFVDGKGKGLILLLCGPPGTGKTLTAESVSENLERPLYRLDASDLGMNTHDLEHRLRLALNRCARWDAILLLDEADVFLETRSSSNLVQNELTSIFLRLLEYYKGVMILTTNRFPAIDPAFESRIDIALPFKDHDAASRAKIWYNFLVREDTILADDSAAIEKLAGLPLNGRQIKSAVKTARILAASENIPLGIDHLHIVVDMRIKALQLLS